MVIIPIKRDMLCWRMNSSKPSTLNSVPICIKWDGADYNMKFVEGGFFSLDGYYPDQKGYALLANEFIKAINLKFGSDLYQVGWGRLQHEICGGRIFFTGWLSSRSKGICFAGE